MDLNAKISQCEADIKKLEENKKELLRQKKELETYKKGDRFIKNGYTYVLVHDVDKWGLVNIDTGNTGDSFYHVNDCDGDYRSIRKLPTCIPERYTKI